MDSSKQIEKIKLLRQLRIINAKESFWEYCKAIAPDFYKEDRHHLKTLCDILQEIYEGTLINPLTSNPYKRLMINMPPRHGKSRTLVLFCQWCLGVERSSKIITCSYNDDLASDFSRYTRDGIMEVRTDELGIVYSDIFPDSKIKRGNAGFEQWALDGQFFNYKGAGVGGSITGKGANITIVDDIVKDALTAFNDEALKKIWLWYTGTFLSRNEEGGIQIINMTRWSKNDVCGRILSGDEANEWYVSKMEAYDKKTDKMLCDELLSKTTYLSLKKNMDQLIFKANYHQEPVDVQGRLYKDLKTYEVLPHDENRKCLIETIKSYTDTADTGTDYLCCIIYGVYQGEAYILDVVYTQEAMEITEPLTAKALHNNNTKLSFIESNNGGRGFARNVQKLLWDNYKNRTTSIQWFHQSQNKQSRILTNSTFIMDHVYFPVGWNKKWKQFYNDITNYQRQGKNKHDDCADALTGVAETISKNQSELRITRF